MSVPFRRLLQQLTGVSLCAVESFLLTSSGESVSSIFPSCAFRVVFLAATRQSFVSSYCSILNLALTRHSPPPVAL